MKIVNKEVAAGATHATNTIYTEAVPVKYGFGVSFVGQFLSTHAEGVLRIEVSNDDGDPTAGAPTRWAPLNNTDFPGAQVTIDGDTEVVAYVGAQIYARWIRAAFVPSQSDNVAGTWNVRVNAKGW